MARARARSGKVLAAHGAEVATADLDDPVSLERALDAAFGACFVTNFREHFSPGKENAQARILVQAFTT